MSLLSKTGSIVLASVATLSLCASTAVASTVHQTPTNHHAAEKATFTLQNIARQRIKAPAASYQSMKAAQNIASEAADIQILKSSDSYAVADLTMANADRGKGRAMWAAAPDFVDLSWQLPRGATGAVIFKNNLEIASVDSDNFRDTDVVPGELASYRVETVGNDSAEAATWGLEVTVPEGSGSQSSISSAASDISVAAAARTTSAVRHQTFIPMAKVNAPPAGCGQYSGSKFEFDGNNRSWNPTGSYKTRVTAGIDWTQNGKLTSATKGVSSTKVYNKSTKKLLATKKASSANISVSRLSLSNSKEVDLRFKVHSGNPFCTGVPNAIEAAFTMTVTRAGSWSIISGEHRQMPNHEIAIHGGNGAFRNVYTRAYRDATCLVRFVCPVVKLAGYRGGY